MKTIKLLSVLIFFPLLVNAQAVNTVFTYQGELFVNGSPANGTYDMSFDAYGGATGGTSLLFFGADIHTGVVVTNGIFTVPDVDFGNLIFSGSADTWLELAIKPTSSGSYNTLSPRQKITTAPYAVKADFANNATIANDLSVTATASEVLVFDGTNWKSGGNKIRVSNVGVSIGTTSVPPPDGLRVGGALQVDGIGSNVALDVDSDGAGVQDDPLRVRKNGAIKFYVDSNGGASVGSWNTPPSDGLRVKGASQFNGIMTQDASATGLPKFYVRVTCGNSGTGSLTSENLTNTVGNVSSSANGVGGCIINYPIDISGHYWQVTAVSADAAIASCTIGSTVQVLVCQRSNRLGGFENGDIMIILY